MDIAAPTSNITDDQELAKVLEGMNQQAGTGAPAVPPADEPEKPAEEAPASDGMSFEEAPIAPAAETSEPAPAAEPATEEPAVTPEPVVTPEPPTAPEPTVTPTIDSPTPSTSPELDSIKKTALEELRPLVDKLDLPPNEKFDTLLLLIRSTDDKTLVGAAHKAARAIEDETKRAQALLDVIKEIDYFSGNGQQPTA